MVTASISTIIFFSLRCCDYISIIKFIFFLYLKFTHRSRDVRSHPIENNFPLAGSVSRSIKTILPMTRGIRRARSFLSSTPGPLADSWLNAGSIIRLQRDGTLPLRFRCESFEFRLPIKLKCNFPPPFRLPRCRQRPSVFLSAISFRRHGSSPFQNEVANFRRNQYWGFSPLWRLLFFYCAKW